MGLFDSVPEESCNVPYRGIGICFVIIWTEDLEISKVL